MNRDIPAPTAQVSLTPTLLVTEDDLRSMIVQEIASLTEAAPLDVDIDARFERLGLDSMDALTVLGGLEDRLHVELDATMIYDYPTTRKFSRAIAELLGRLQSPPQA